MDYGLILGKVTLDTSRISITILNPLSMTFKFETVQSWIFMLLVKLILGTNR